MSDFQKQNKILSREMPIINPEIPSVPEIFEVQSNVEKPREIQPEQPSSVPAPTPSHVIPASDRVEHPQTKSQELQAIEKVMASGLEEIYNNLDSKTKQMLKLEGEKTASQIEILLEQGKDAAKKVLQLIRDWLHKIPGVNRFFLEQESKIKTDKILAMTNKGK
ncbi:MAG: hypothetical protein Q8L21_03540 [Candidatus Komeilibacteria bacterium]|nr:hypothetical protein [Candidatus Komeilibacteria bacterium]